MNVVFLLAAQVFGVQIGVADLATRGHNLGSRSPFPFRLGRAHPAPGTEGVEARRALSDRLLLGSTREEKLPLTSH